MAVFSTTSQTDIDNQSVLARLKSWWRDLRTASPAPWACRARAHSTTNRWRRVFGARGNAADDGGWLSGADGVVLWIWHQRLSAVRAAGRCVKPHHRHQTHFLSTVAAAAAATDAAGCFTHDARSMWLRGFDARDSAWHRRIGEWVV